MRNLGLELVFLSKVAQPPSNPHMPYLQSDLALSALGISVMTLCIALVIWGVSAKPDFMKKILQVCGIFFFWTPVLESFCPMGSTSLTQIQFSWKHEPPHSIS